MFSKLFTPKLKHPDPAKRLAALKSLTAKDQDIEQLSQLALTDEDSGVREHALSLFFEKMTEQTTIDNSTAMALFARADATNKEKLIGHINDHDELHQCIDATDDQTVLMLIASKSVLPVIRKYAAEKISGLDNLKQLQAQTSDKNVLQVTRQKINEIKSQQKARQAANETLNQICDALERLSRSEFESMTTSRIKLLESHWQELDDEYKAEFVERYEQACQRCYELIRLEREQQALAEYEQAQNEVCQAVCEDFENEISTLELGSLDHWSKVRLRHEQNWASANKAFTPAVEVSERFFSLKPIADNIDSLITELKTEFSDFDPEQILAQDVETLHIAEQKLYNLTRQLSWPYKLKQPQLYVQLKSQHQQVKKQLQEKKKAQKKKLAQIDTKVTILKSHIRQKNLIKANRMFNYIQNLIEELPEALRVTEHSKMEAVVNALNELRGLNEFITQPKKLELCEQMEALVNKKVPAEKLMDEIKRIQQKWKSLATSDADADDVLWERFKQAADKAYEPCAAYLNEQEKLKNKNLEGRIALIGKLEKQLGEQSWEHVDWKQVQQDYTQYWKQWRALAPVFFSQNKPHQKTFESLIGEYKTRLDAEKNENHELYNQLIDRVGKLSEELTEDNVDDAIEQVKRIQASWKNIGITHFNKSRKQWNKFQKTCDSVFEFQRLKHKSIREQENQQMDEVHALVNNIKALIKLPDETFASSQADYQALVEAFENIELPAFHEEKGARLFNRVCEDYQTHLAGLGQRSKQQAHKLTRQAAQLCNNAETLAQTGADRNEFNALKTEFDSMTLNKTIAENLNQRIETAAIILDNPDNHNPQQCSENEQCLAQLAIELEVLFDLKTPDHALKQRMDYQLEQLQQGLKPTLTPAEKLQQLEELETRWYQVGMVSVEARASLEQRLAQVIKKAEN